MTVDTPEEGATVLSFAVKAAEARKAPEKTIIANSRRYQQNVCRHRGPYLVDRTLASVECRDCGAMLNPIFVLEVLAAHESYWNERAKDLRKYLDEVKVELDGRTRTKCTHCGNMTAIRLTKEPPRTWYRGVE